MKGRLVFWHKARLKNHYLMEMEIYEIDPSHSIGMVFVIG
jgi:hypothetical protein